jgi:hypothetical protein
MPFLGVVFFWDKNLFSKSCKLFLNVHFLENKFSNKLPLGLCRLLLSCLWKYRVVDLSSRPHHNTEWYTIANLRAGVPQAWQLEYQNIIVTIPQTWELSNTNLGATISQTWVLQQQELQTWEQCHRRPRRPPQTSRRFLWSSQISIRQWRG